MLIWTVIPIVREEERRVVGKRFRFEILEAYKE